ncbi:MAG: AAA family ATPase [Acidobacteria bacterium]|nr:AAA family ATPase [Acidobacteriota bacterium]
MGFFKRDYEKVSEAPTHPASPAAGRPRFDVADLYQGPVDDGRAAEPGAVPLDEKFRQVYFWVTNHAIISPHYDIEYNDTPPLSYEFGDAKVTVRLPSDQSYSSFVLLPLLTLAVRRRCLLVGGPGRGKTAIAILMGVLSGYSLREIRRAIQHGQPQMTVADLLGNPLPSSMVSAASNEDIRIAWRKWLGMRIKIIDEYNRIPTRTQSALLTVMADNYAEMYDQVFECPEAAWYLTANDDAGGGTYQVIEALRDRIDVVVRALHFNTRFLGELLTRLEENVRPEEVVPSRLVFTETELDAAEAQVRAVGFPAPLLKRLEFFAGHFEFFEPAAHQVEYMTKDTVKLAGADLVALAAGETGRDRAVDLGGQTLNGLSVRALMTALAYVKAAAWFRGRPSVDFEDVRQVLPFVLQDKLVPNPESPFFEQGRNAALRTDRVSWIRSLFDAACKEYDRLDLDRADPLTPLEEEFGSGLVGVAEGDVRRRLAKVEKVLREWSASRKLYGHMYDRILKLKYLHQRYTNYLRWLKWKP